MTVCIAAKCLWEGQPAIVGATDRQFTAADMKYESDRTKIGFVRLPILALQSGDDAQYYAIFKDTARLVKQKRIKDVRGVAEVYGDELCKYRLRRAERVVLGPLGLNLETFLTRKSKKLTPEILFNLFAQFYGKEASVEVETLIAGVDKTGAHIYKVEDPGEVTLQDGVGFAAVGEGYWHAETVFMSLGYHFNWTAHQALIVALLAKKRAQFATSVGRATDLYLVLPNYGGFVIPQSLLDELQLDALYDELFAKMTRATEEVTNVLAERATKIMDLGRTLEDEAKSKKGHHKGNAR